METQRRKCVEFLDISLYGICIYRQPSFLEPNRKWHNWLIRILFNTQRWDWKSIAKYSLKQMYVEVPRILVPDNSHVNFFNILILLRTKKFKYLSPRAHISLLVAQTQEFKASVVDVPFKNQCRYVHILFLLLYNDLACMFSFFFLFCFCFEIKSCSVE